MTATLLDRPTGPTDVTCLADVVDEVTRRRLLAALGAGGLLAGCAPGESTATPTASGDASGYPRTVTHYGGESVIQRRPQRVMSNFNAYEFDALLALGVPIAGRGEASGNDLFPWQAEAGGADVPVLPIYGDNVEAFAASDPDVMFMIDLNYGDGSNPVLAAYEQVAPIIGIPQGIEEPLRIVADVMDIAPSVLDDLLAGTDAVIAAFTPARVPASVVAFYYYDDGLLYLVNDRSPMSNLLQRAGLPALSAPTPGPEEIATTAVSIERFDLLEADLLMGLLDGDFDAAFDALEQDPLFQSLDVVQRGGFLRPTADEGRAMTRPSVLSIPTALAALGRLL